MNKTLILSALGGVLAMGGCASNAPTAQAENKGTVVITSPAKPTTEGHGDGHGDAAHGSTVHTHTTRMRVTTVPATVEAGKSATITLQIVDNADSTPINDFEVVHDKKLHMILVSEDLNWFSHLHPELVGEGKFRVTTTIPKAGKFRVYADYKPTGEEGEIALGALEVKGANPLPSTPKLVADKMEGAWMTKTVSSAPEGVAATPDAPKYQVALMPMPAKIVAGEDVMLHFQVRDADGKPLENLQPYLGAMGHCVILAADPKTYLHTHPMEMEESVGSDAHAAHGASGNATSGNAVSEHASGGSDVMFHTNFPSAGLYKAWGQFQHNDKIITAPFVVSVAAGKKVAAKAETPVEIPANAQKVSIELPAGYKNGAATVKAGTPVALTFHLKSDAGCGNAIAVPAANWKRTLKVGESATVVYTPTKTGELKFACSMDMYKGTLTVK